MSTESCRRGLPVRPGDSNNPGATNLASFANISVSPMIGMPACRALSTVQCGSGWVSGTPGLRTSASSLSKSSPWRFVTGSPASFAFSVDGAESSHAWTSAPLSAMPQCMPYPNAPDQTQPRVCPYMQKPETRSIYLSFNVERPTNAKTMAMIQKRMTMVGSFQPFCSK